MLYDAHCHPTDDVETLPSLAQMDATLCIMATRFDDVALVADAADKYPNVIPSFGLHPWYAHLVYFEETMKRKHYEGLFGEISDSELELLPDPTSMHTHLAKLEAMLKKYPKALVGEVGLDKAFRIKFDYGLSKLKTSMDHQQRVLESQLKLAQKLRRPVSLHGVQCHMPLFETCLKFPDIPAICLHSFSGSPDFLKNRWMKSKKQRIYASIAVLINATNKEKALNLIKSIPPDRVLSESDYHSAGQHMQDLLQESVNLIQQAGVEPQQIERNFHEYVH